MISVVEKVTMPTWGRQYAEPIGFIGQIGPGRYAHRFGGDDWSLLGVDIDDFPIILTLDLRDPDVNFANTQAIDELPLCSHLSRDIWVSPQSYLLKPSERQIVLQNRGEPATDTFIPEFAGPLPQKPLHFEPMSATDYPTSEANYWKACDDFLGGGRLLRIGGPPLWLYAPVSVTCSCGGPMSWIGALGYDRDSDPALQFVNNEPFFIGEAALYWFLCARCLIVGVISQPS